MSIRRRNLLLACLATCASAASAQPGATDQWEPIRRLAGNWSGTSTGNPGDGTVTRRYNWVLGDRYLHEVNTSVYPPQERNKKGERHDHWSLFSYDRARKLIVMRQFHIEGFVNTYRLVQAGPNKIVFESEAFENLSNSWRARESYEFTDPNEVVEIFELAAPGKEFEIYVRANLQRAAQ